MDERFQCRATAAVLRSGSSIALAGHVAALLCAALRPGAWGPLIAWCALTYLAFRVDLDARLFELLAEYPPASLDEWMATAGLKKNAGPRTLRDRSSGAMRYWRALLLALAVEILLVIGTLAWSPR